MIEPVSVLNRKYQLILSAAACAFLIGACTPGPEYSRPETPLSKMEKFKNAPAQVQDESKNNVENKTGYSEKMAHWWRHINHPEINRQIGMILNQNLDLKQARARINQAKARIRISAGPLAPMISVNASRNRNFRPAEEFSNIFGGAVGAPGGGGTTRIFDTSIETSATASWQLDLFGRTRNALAASKARFYAAEMDQEALKHTLISELVQRHIALQSLGARKRLAHNIAENRKAVLSIVKRRYERGTAGVNTSDLHAAQQAVAQVTQDIPEIEQAIGEQSHSIDVILGQQPGTRDYDIKSTAFNPPPAKTPISVPAALLDRRPDLRSAEMRVIAEYKDISVSISDLYPNISLSGNLGFEDETTRNLFSSERLIGSILSEISLTLFQGGALRARIDLEKAQKEELVASYAKDILNAIQEVETALLQEKKIAQRLDEINKEVLAARQRMRALKNRYEKGVISLSQYLDSQLDLYNARLKRILGIQAMWQARISLYLALGGDWINEMEISGEEHNGPTRHHLNKGKG